MIDITNTKFPRKVICVDDFHSILERGKIYEANGIKKGCRELVFEEGELDGWYISRFNELADAPDSPSDTLFDVAKDICSGMNPLENVGCIAPGSLVEGNCPGLKYEPPKVLKSKYDEDIKTMDRMITVCKIDVEEYKAALEQTSRALDLAVKAFVKSELKHHNGSIETYFRSKFYQDAKSLEAKNE